MPAHTAAGSSWRSRLSTLAAAALQSLAAAWLHCVVCSQPLVAVALLECVVCSQPVGLVLVLCLALERPLLWCVFRDDALVMLLLIWHSLFCLFCSASPHKCHALVVILVQRTVLLLPSYNSVLQTYGRCQWLVSLGGLCCGVYVSFTWVRHKSFCGGCKSWEALRPECHFVLCCVLALCMLPPSTCSLCSSGDCRLVCACASCDLLVYWNTTRLSSCCACHARSRWLLAKIYLVLLGQLERVVSRHRPQPPTALSWFCKSRPVHVLHCGTTLWMGGLTG